MDRLVEYARSNIIRFGQYDVAQSPVLNKAISRATENPKLVLKTFLVYRRVIGHLFELTPEDLQIVERVNTALHKPRGAHEFLKHMMPYRDHILNAIGHAGEINKETNRSGIANLAQMMGNAWEIRQKDPTWVPKEGDPRSDKVIYGFVKGAKNPEIDVDFTICHALERIATASVQVKGITDHKDWILEPITDVVALRGLQGRLPEAQVIDIWSKPRPDGLGWISQDQIHAYKKLLAG